MKTKIRNVNGTNGTKADKKIMRQKMRQRMWQDRQLYIMISIPLIFLFLFSYWPMYGVLISFQKFSPTRGVFGSKWIGLSNFKRFFSTPSATRTITNTFRISLYSLIAGIPFPILLAILLNECRGGRYKKAVQMITYAPYFISTVVMVAILFQLLDPRTGLVNVFLNKLGIGPVSFMTDQSLFRSVYVWSGLWQTTGFNAIIYISALSAIDQELYEAARIDGANRLQKIWYIDLPGILPTFTIMFIMSCGSIMSVGFEKVYLMQNSANLAVSEVLSTYTYKMGLINLDYGYSSAVGLFNSIINTLFIVLVNTISRRTSETSLW
ncbi:sugar ABC transporter permease [Blautia sp. OF03-15BH]|uniref:ABC transporter permease n=1 Tax=Blautia sp. OF03-15BH TaxID=2292287 RepID=UPI000E4D5FF1|nr:ABC transporter permease subunit [Blautia sp. OF03-15BH]RGY01326.1 sugar ABC transporter permease [Blautia sp. OF03-15BH]